MDNIVRTEVPGTLAILSQASPPPNYAFSPLFHLFGRHPWLIFPPLRAPKNDIREKGFNHLILLKFSASSRSRTLGPKASRLVSELLAKL